jgi:hypothetical protein
LIDSQFAYADMTLRLHKAIADTKDVDARRQYQEILNYITDSSKEFFISKNQSDATNALNETTLQEDEHNLNIASIRAKKLEGDLLQANLAWLPREKAALISQAYAQAYAATASGKAAVQAAENTAQEAYGKRFDNKMRDQLHDVILNSDYQQNLLTDFEKQLKRHQPDLMTYQQNLEKLERIVPDQSNLHFA